ALDYTETMIRVNDLVADLECHVSPVRKMVARRRGLERVEPFQYSAPASVDQSKCSEIGQFLRISWSSATRAPCAATAEVVRQPLARSRLVRAGLPRDTPAADVSGHGRGRRPGLPSSPDVRCQSVGPVSSSGGPSGPPGMRG